MMLTLEHSFIYFPARQLVGQPADLGLPFESVRFGPLGRLHGWFIPGPGPLSLIWLHGNAGNIAHRLPWVKELRNRLGLNVFIFDYRGYGLSDGSPSEENTYQDARDALAYLRSRSDVEPERIVYFGKSLGGAIALQLATEEAPYRLVLQSTFTSLLDLARLHYPFIPIGLLRSRYASIEKIGSLEVPLLIVHGSDDEIVPLEQARRLYAAANEPKRLFVLEGARHNTILDEGGAPYYAALRAFLTDPPGTLRSEPPLAE
jgi:uncharacterized protein